MKTFEKRNNGEEDDQEATCSKKRERKSEGEVESRRISASCKKPSGVENENSQSQKK